MPPRFLAQIAKIRILHFNRPDAQVSLRPRQPLAFAAVLLAFIWYLLAPTAVSATIASGLGGIVLSAYLWARATALGMSAKRKLQYTALQVGDELEERITLRNDSGLPLLWAEFVDRSAIPGYTVSSVRAADAHSQTEWRAHTTCTRRGVFRLGPWEVHSADPFGLFEIRLVYPQHEEILVYPSLAVLPPALLPHRSILGDQRPLFQPLAAETINAITTRPFVPGDPLRRVHWPTSARRETPFVKTFEPEASSSVWLIPDFDAATQYGQGADTTTELIVTLAASLAAELLHAGLGVGLFAYTDCEQVSMPRHGTPQLWNILRALAPLEAISPLPLDESLQRARTLIQPQDLLLVLTPSLSPAWPRILRQIAPRRGSGRAEVLLIDPASFGGSQSAALLAPYLLELGIPARVVRRGDVTPISGSYGELRRWEFTTLGTGRVVVRKAPRQAQEPHP